MFVKIKSTKNFAHKVPLLVDSLRHGLHHSPNSLDPTVWNPYLEAKNQYTQSSIKAQKQPSLLMSSQSTEDQTLSNYNLKIRNRTHSQTKIQFVFSSSTKFNKQQENFARSLHFREEEQMGKNPRDLDAQRQQINYKLEIYLEGMMSNPQRTKNFGPYNKKTSIVKFQRGKDLNNQQAMRLKR